MFVRFASLLMLLCAAANPLHADDGEPDNRQEDMDDVFDRGCRDDQGTDRCDAIIQQEMRNLYGWVSAQELDQKLVQFRRFMMVNGYGRDVVGLTFQKSLGAPALVIVDVPENSDAGTAVSRFTPQPLKAQLTNEQWEEVVALTADFDAEIPPKPDEDSGDTIRICLHGWFTVMEAGDAKDDTGIRRTAESACADGNAMPASFALAEVALAVFTECAPLGVINYRNALTELAACKQLGGDRHVAAEVAVHLEAIELALDDGSDDGLTSFFLAKDEAHSFALASRLAKRTVYWDAPNALSANTVTVRGHVDADQQPPDEDNARAYHGIMLNLEKTDGKWFVAAYDISDIKTKIYEN